MLIYRCILFSTLKYVHDMTLCFDEFNDLCKEAGATKPGAVGVAGGVAGGS